MEVEVVAIGSPKGEKSKKHSWVNLQVESSELVKRIKELLDKSRYLILTIWVSE